MTRPSSGGVEPGAAGWPSGARGPHHHPAASVTPADAVVGHARARSQIDAIVADLGRECGENLSAGVLTTPTRLCADPAVVVVIRVPLALLGAHPAGLGA
jgi:hypothetical protein